MKRLFALVFVFTVGVSGTLGPAEAGDISFTRNVTRNINRTVDRRGFGGGGQFLNTFFGLANTFVSSQLQPTGLVDDLLKELVKNLIGAGAGAQGAGPMVAQRVATPDPNLVTADQKVRDMCTKLKIPFVEIQQTTTTGPVSSPAGLHPNFALPAPVPATFVAPAGTPPVP